MDDYYALRYKSSPEITAYILHKNGDDLELVGSSLSPKKMGISLDDKGKIILPKYFCSLISVDKGFVFRTISNKIDSKIEKMVGSL